MLLKRQAIERYSSGRRSCGRGPACSSEEKKKKKRGEKQGKDLFAVVPPAYLDHKLPTLLLSR
jgi:hypothetical protein